MIGHGGRTGNITPASDCASAPEPTSSPLQPLPQRRRTMGREADDSDQHWNRGTQNLSNSRDRSQLQTGSNARSVECYSSPIELPISPPSPPIELPASPPGRVPQTSGECSMRNRDTSAKPSKSTYNSRSTRKPEHNGHRRSSSSDYHQNSDLLPDRARTSSAIKTKGSRQERSFTFTKSPLSRLEAKYRNSPSSYRGYISDEDESQVDIASTVSQSQLGGGSVYDA